MALAGDQFERLQKALLKAFPSHEKLAAMVRIRLDEHLEAIAGGQDLTDVVFHLITWAESTGGVEALAIGAHQHNPTNGQLRAFVKDKYGKVLPLTRSTTNGWQVSLGQGELINDMVLIPGGEFLMGVDCASETLDEFIVDRCPVTNTEYKAFVDATKRDPLCHWITGSVPPGLENHPVVNVTWYDAQAYAEWCAKKLPTSAQWEKAARGTDGRQFPWGNEFDPSKCNTREGAAGTTTPVGEYPGGASPFGVLDMAGNVWEWTRGGKDRERAAIRGGAWKLVSAHAKCFYTSTQNRGFSNDDLGFRCVLD